MSEQPTADIEAIQKLIYIVSKTSVYDAKEYVAKMPNTAKWGAVRNLLGELNSRRTTEANLNHLRHLLRVKKNQEATNV